MLQYPPSFDRGALAVSGKASDFLRPLWERGALSYIFISISPDFDFWKRLGAQDMTISGFHAGPQILNIG